MKTHIKFKFHLNIRLFSRTLIKINMKKFKLIWTWTLCGNNKFEDA